MGICSQGIGTYVGDCAVNRILELPEVHLSVK